jgi:hypothetical protein
MSFSASTCITYTGTTPLGDTIYIYSDIDGYTTPFTIEPLENLIGINCPYTVNGIPDGTTSIQLRDPSTTCCITIPIESIPDLCTICTLNFDVYSASTTGLIVAGNLTGDCQASITDYVISWYGPGAGSTNVAYTSGFGSAFTPYDFTHPLTGTSAIFSEQGVYTPVIDKVIISGVSYSQVGEVGESPAVLNCFTDQYIEVNPFTCDNGSEVGNYTHRVNFTGVGSGVVSPPPLKSTFVLSSTTTYFAWKFKGEGVPDRLTLTFSGSSYPVPIVLEDILVGDNLSSSNFTLTSFPKSADTFGYVTKVTCLTGLTTNAGDFITLNVTPSTNPATNWDFYFTCLSGEFDCTTCLDTESPYKIVGSTITGITGSCDTSYIRFSVSGCSLTTNNQFDFFKYYDFSTYIGARQSVDTSSPSNLLIRQTNNLFYSAITCSVYYFNFNSPICSSANTNTITFNKSVISGIGNIYITFDSINDFNSYYDSYLTCLSFSGNPYDDTDIDYYRAITLYTPIYSSPSAVCGDGTSSQFYYIHPSSVVTTGQTGGTYSMNITMPTIVNNLDAPACSNCSTNSSFIVVNSFINPSSTGTTNNLNMTTNTGSKYNYPFIGVTGVHSASTTSTEFSLRGFVTTTKYLNETYPSSGVTNTLIPELSGKTCDLDSNMCLNFNNFNNLSTYIKFAYYYQIKLTNPLDLRDFEIYARTLPCGTLPETLIYNYSGGTVNYSDPAYII